MGRDGRNRPGDAKAKGEEAVNEIDRKIAERLGYTVALLNYNIRIRLGLPDQPSIYYGLLDPGNRLIPLSPHTKPDICWSYAPRWSEHIDMVLALAAELKLIYRIEQDSAWHDAGEPLVVYLYEPDDHRLMASFGASGVDKLAGAVAAAILAWLEAKGDAP